jgi:uracil-DNA glycosylase family 4
MSLLLDERRQAMLQEMGIRSFGLGLQPGRIDDIPPVAQPPAPKPLAQPTGLVAAASAVELMQWDALAHAVSQCRRCALCEGRRNTVFGAGDRQADWLIVGEAPGESEDLQGEPFVGQAGVLLDNMLKAIGLSRERNVYLTNVLKCRPPGNRNPEPHEVAQCAPYLQRQVQLLQPKIILAMGRFAVQALLQSNEPIGKLRGQVHRYNGVPVVVTYHPGYLLRNLPDKARAWADLCLALEVLQQPAKASTG